MLRISLEAVGYWRVLVYIIQWLYVCQPKGLLGEYERDVCTGMAKEDL